MIDVQLGRMGQNVEMSANVKMEELVMRRLGNATALLDGV